VDLESTLDELYALRPQEFTAARDERAAEARRAGDRELADRIRSLRRPTLAAWAGNLLVRREPDRIRPLLSLGEGLRDAHRNLDGEQLRELGRQQHLLVGALAGEARRLAAEAGQPVGESALQEIEATLHAVLADPDAARQWAAGHLDRPLSAPVGFAGLEAGADATPRPAERSGPASRGTAEPSGRAGRPAEPRTRTETTDRTDPAGRRRREKLDRAGQDARAAEEQARESEQARDEATAALEREQAAFDDAKERVASLARELEEAQARQRRTESALREARDGARRAERTARDARRRAEKAGAAVDRLSAPGG
jgi:hypothetical protein